MSLDTAATIVVFLVVTAMAVTHVIRLDITLKHIGKISDCADVSDRPEKEKE